MNLIPVFKNISREELSAKWEVEFPLSEWTVIKLPFDKVKILDESLEKDLYQDGDDVEYETNRYDIKYHDVVLNKTISVYLYMNEDSNQIIAIDNVVQDSNEKDVRYPLEETPFQIMINSL